MIREGESQAGQPSILFVSLSPPIPKPFAWPWTLILPPWFLPTIPFLSLGPRFQHRLQSMPQAPPVNFCHLEISHGAQPTT